MIHNIENASRKKDKRHHRGRHGSTGDAYDDNEDSPSSHAETAAVMEDVSNQKRVTSSLAQQLDDLKERLEHQEKKLHGLNFFFTISFSNFTFNFCTSIAV